jgi:hypothetical protein
MTPEETEAIRTWLANWAGAQPLSDIAIRETVDRCRADAELSGIKAVELEAAVGDLERYFLDDINVLRR